MRILSLFDASGVWSDPWREVGEVMALDLSRGDDLSDSETVRQVCEWPRFDVILAAPPCTVFCRPGARLWREWDANGRTDRHVQLVRNTLKIIDAHKPKVWAIENPPGRLARLVPEMGEKSFSFHPWEFAGWADDPESEAHTKHTYLWGQFQAPAPDPREPEPYPDHLPPGRRDPTSRVSSSWKKQRERTPQGFARAFFEANR